jgi:predicted phosphohydrolase
MGKALAGERPLIVAIHYPPFTARGESTAFSELIEASGVALCVYGHLHGRHAHRTAVEGDVRGVRYRLIACDRLAFRPVQVWPDPVS